MRRIGESIFHPDCSKFCVPSASSLSASAEICSATFHRRAGASLKLKMYMCCAEAMVAGAVSQFGFC